MQNVTHAFQHTGARATRRTLALARSYKKLDAKKHKTQSTHRKEKQIMSNIPHPDQDLLIELSPEQQNCGLTKPTDFEIGGQTKEYAALLAEVDEANEPIPDRNEVPCRAR